MEGGSEQVSRARKARSSGAKPGAAARAKKRRARVSGAEVIRPATPTTDTPLPSYVQPETAVEWLANLEQSADVQAYKVVSYAMLELAPGESVLDLGCGRGDDVRALAARVAPGGKVTGVDVSAEMIAAARQLTDNGNPQDVQDARVEIAFAAADGARLPFADQTFDAVRLDRVLQHVDAPDVVLREVNRVLRPGGRVVLIEPDWKMMAVYPGSAAGGDDDAIIDAILGWQVAHTRHPLIGRQLGALLVDARFEQVRVRPVAYSSTSFVLADLVLELSVAGAQAAADSPRLRVEDMQEWVVAARQAEAHSQFLACLTLFFARARKSATGPMGGGKQDTETLRGPEPRRSGTVELGEEGRGEDVHLI